MHCFCSQDHCENDQCTVCNHLSQDQSMQSSESTLREWRGPDNEGLVPVLDGWHEDVVEAVEAVEAVEVRVAVELINDLKAAVEVNSSEGRYVLYPHKSRKFDSMPLEIAVSIRDDPSIQGTCKEFVGTRLFTSSGFGNFGAEAQSFIKNEEISIQAEQRLRKRQFDELENKRWWAAEWPWFKGNLCLWGGLLVFLVVCITVPLERVELAGVLCLGAGCLSCCTCTISSLWMWYITTKNAEVGFQSHTHGERNVNVFCCLCCLVFVLLLVMTVTYPIRGFLSAPIFLWAVLLLGFCCLIPVSCAGAEMLSLWEDQLSKQGAQNFRDRTIVFKGNILRGKPCVSSWPGKYESAWDELVRGSRQGHLSAAVVFLPEGSRHFGIHDPIPKAEDLPGSCWCTPLYGEQKPWGCRWWTLWIKNIEKAMKKGAKLQVYFFHKMKGKGKVENFSTAGAEHLRRERIFSRKGAFKESQEFESAVSEGLKELSTNKCGDGSSQYSREEHRLFLSWLDEEDREFLISSEGLGNSQKAEVAWLQRKSYPFEEVEVDISKWAESD